MDSFISRKRRRLSPPTEDEQNRRSKYFAQEPQEDSTELKLAILSSLHPNIDQGVLLEVLLSADGSVEEASEALENQAKANNTSPRKKFASGILGQQMSLSSFVALPSADNTEPPRKRPLTKKGKTLYLFAPEDIAADTPCSIIHNFLPAEEANDLLRELLDEAPTFPRQTFKLFDSVVQSPHSACFYVASEEEMHVQKTEYVYNGSYLTDIRRMPPHLLHISRAVQKTVNTEIASRIRTHFPNAEKLKYQSAEPWIPNAAFVNCYDGGQESVGYHSDQLTYLGPRAVIGSLSLGVAREFRIRRVVPRDDDDKGEGKEERADQEGQLSIHLPHNSLLIMHANMQEEWKHSIHPAPTWVPHPISGNKRINITYRYYRPDFHPGFTPRCKCDIAAVLRVVQRKKENWGRYFWMCHGGAVPGKEGCSFFKWAEFSEDGVPEWIGKGEVSQSGEG